MTLNSLASQIAKLEAKKSSVGIGNIREILRIIVELEVESWKGDQPGPANVIIKASHKILDKALEQKKPKVKREKA